MTIRVENVGCFKKNNSRTELLSAWVEQFDPMSDMDQLELVYYITSQFQVYKAWINQIPILK